jgi:hypothetical protein
MKYLKETLFTALITLFSITSYAQKTSVDSLFVEIDNKIEVKMSIYEYSDLKENVGKHLVELQEILKVNQDVPQNSSYIISFKPGEKLTIKSKETTETIIWKNGENNPYKFKNSCEVITDNYQIYIDFNDYEDLISENLITKITEAVDNTLANNSRRSKLFKYSFEKDSLVKNENYGIGKTGDMLSLKAGVGANLIKNQPVIDLSGEVAFIFQKKGILKNQYYLSYNLLYDFVDNSSIDINSFLNVGYRYNFSNNKDDSNWLGLELGYLVSKNGDMFDDNTFRFGFNWQVGNNITISPQLYISSEQTYPGLRIGFGF